MKKDSYQPLGLTSLALTFGFTMILGSIGGYYGGKYLDAKLGTAPWFAFLGIMLAIIGTFIRLIRDLTSRGE